MDKRSSSNLKGFPRSARNEVDESLRRPLEIENLRSRKSRSRILLAIETSGEEAGDVDFYGERLAASCQWSPHSLRSFSAKFQREGDGMKRARGDTEHAATRRAAERRRGLVARNAPVGRR